MCGIAGFFERDRTRAADRDVLARMVEVIHHRGPDSAGAVVVGPAALGMPRLAVIDISGGFQPMSDDAEDVWIVFNGEIYNFRELALDLERDGVRLHTHS